MQDNEHMASAGPVTGPAGRRVPGGRLAVFATRRARELLFCLAEVPLGLCPLAVLVALTGVPVGVTALVRGDNPASAQAQPRAAVSFLGVAVIVALLALCVRNPRLARPLGAVHRRLAEGWLGERIAGPPPLRGDGGWLRATLRDRPGWRAAAYLLVKLPVTVAEGYAVFFAAAG